jgi:hypothetical protein
MNRIIDRYAEEYRTECQADAVYGSPDGGGYGNGNQETTGDWHKYEYHER